MTKNRQAGISRRQFSKLAFGLGAVPPLMAAMPRLASAQAEPFKIGVLNDMSGLVADLSGRGTLTSVRMAVEDFGGSVLGRPIEVLSGDHMNKADVGMGMARKWYDEGVNAIFDIGLTTVAVGTQELAREKNKLVVLLSTASSDLTGKFCGPNGIHWAYNSYSQAIGVIRHHLEAQEKSWYFLTVDYAYGHNIQRDTTALIEAAGGTVVGSTLHPFDTTDFSSDILKAQASGAQVIGLAANQCANIIKQASEFGIVESGQKLAPLSLTLHDVKGLGLDKGQGLLLTSPYYWNQNDGTREFADRFMKAFGKMPNMIQASAYGAVMHYLKAVAAAGTDDTGPVLQLMRDTPVNDFMTKDGTLRKDGQLVRDNYTFRIKRPQDSTGEWDLYEQVDTVPAADAFQAPRPDVCAFT